MEEILDKLRAALAPDATAEQRALGAQACRAMLAVLEPATAPIVPAQVPAPAPPVAAIVAALRAAPPEQLLELAIARLRAALPPGTEAPRAKPINFNLVPVPGKAIR